MTLKPVTGFYIFLIVLLCDTYGEDKYLPEYIKPCTYNEDNFVKCIRDQIEEVLPTFTKGIPKLGVPSIDPVKLDDIVIDGNGLKLFFREAAMHGLSESKITKLNVNLDKADATFSLGFKGNLSLIAQYEIDGRILILPIQGKGDATVKCEGVEVQIDSKMSHVKDAKGEHHLKLITPSYKYTIDKTTFDLQNLFNGNKELAKTTLKFANDNWKQLMDELSPPAIKQIARTCVKSINKFFSSLTTPQIIHGYNVE